MPRLPSHRLDVLIVRAEHPGADVVAALRQQLVDAGVIDEGGRAGPQAQLAFDGGFRWLQFDEPRVPVLYSNRLGGFRVRCPHTGGNLAPTFRVDDGRVACVHCGEQHAVNDVDAQPPIAWGAFAVRFADVEHRLLRTPVEGWLLDQLGDTRTVHSRMPLR